MHKSSRCSVAGLSGNSPKVSPRSAARALERPLGMSEIRTHALESVSGTLPIRYTTMVVSSSDALIADDKLLFRLTRPFIDGWLFNGEGGGVQQRESERELEKRR